MLFFFFFHVGGMGARAAIMVVPMAIRIHAGYNQYKEKCIDKNKFSMHRYNGPEIARPRTMTELRYRDSHNNTASRNTSHRSPQKQTIQEDGEPDLYELTGTSPQTNQKYICIAIPKAMESSDGLYSQRKKTNLYSRENIQLMNKKYREIRTSRMSPSLGLYDLQNDRREMPRAISAMGGYGDAFLSTEMKPFAQSLKKLEKKPATSIKMRRPVKVNNGEVDHREMEAEQGMLRAKSASKMPKPRSQIGDRKNLFPKQKQSQNGYVVHKFESKMKKKCLEDNLHVMATLLKRKIKVLDKKDMMVYLSRLMNRNTIQK